MLNLVILVQMVWAYVVVGGVSKIFGVLRPSIWLRFSHTPKPRHNSDPNPEFIDVWNRVWKPVQWVCLKVRDSCVNTACPMPIVV